MDDGLLWFDLLSSTWANTELQDKIDVESVESMISGQYQTELLFPPETPLSAKPILEAMNTSRTTPLSLSLLTLAVRVQRRSS
ncbi:hypothetical protein RRG08_019991 [Elysia crispata]|uniref:Uncharacterized protein n=1 Tax=Elysia crispata TaxID=231223 RepID=A0AAE1EDN2_9GAST|nr:hypothetical protein RRG08_019991 [Elysia crispata]